MAELSPPVEGVKDLGETAKVIVELVKQVKELTTGKEEGGGGGDRRSRSGPLQIIGGLSIAMVLVPATAATAAGYIDWQIIRSLPRDASSELVAQVRWLSIATFGLRLTFVIVVLVNLAAAVLLIWFLAKRHPALLSSPSEFDSSYVNRGARDPSPVLVGAAARATSSLRTAWQGSDRRGS